MNQDNYKLILQKIKDNPELWKQDTWHCGSAHCFAGLCQIASGHLPDESTVRKDARIFLDLSLADADYLFSPSRTITDFDEFLDRYGFDRSGFNRYGLNRYGFDCNGFNRYGFDCNGFNRYGFDRSGFNRYGFDCCGFDRDGFDRDGLDKNNKPKSAL